MIAGEISRRCHIRNRGVAGADVPASERQVGATAGAVRPACDGQVMDDTMQLRGIELRYVVTMHLLSHGPASISELAEAVAWQGFAVAGRASKSISDALRWEMGYGRVRRLGRGLYGPGWLPRGTEHRIHKRVLALRQQASCRCEAGTSMHPKLLETAGVTEPYGKAR